MVTKNVLIIGCGEVGSALLQIEEEHNNRCVVLEKDTKPTLGMLDTNFDVCHINIPYTHDFENVIMSYMEMFKTPPNLVVINSTVPVGTTRNVAASTDLCVVHSPICGVHPNLYDGIKTFVKFVGGPTDVATLVAEHFNSIGIQTYYCGKYENSELAKLLSTTYYNWCIQFARLANDVCNKTETDFDKVYSAFNKEYNSGYTTLGKRNVVRPILYPPKVEIGGHCIVPNTYLLPPSELKDLITTLNMRVKTAC